MDGGSDDMGDKDGTGKIDTTLGAADDGDKGQSCWAGSCDEKSGAGDPARKMAKGYVGVVEYLVGDAGGCACGIVESEQED